MRNQPIHLIRALAAAAAVACLALTVAPARSLTPGMPANCTGCSFDGRNLRGADFRGALICERRSCRPVDAATLRSHARSGLDGATL